jgi:hypothetical protein
MLFTARGLEQATDEWISRYKASRFAGSAEAADLCCGVGGDLAGLAAVTTATGVDRCQIANLCARHNANVYQPSAAPHRVATCDVTAIDVADYAAWHIDPDRRPHGRRTTRVELHEPGWEDIERMLARQRNAAIKLAPASNLPTNEIWSATTELEWISRNGECRQLVAWCGDLAKHVGTRRATSVGKSGIASFTGAPDVPLIAESEVDRFLFEPDSAVLAAKLTGALAAQYALATISPGIAYLTGPQPLSEPLLTAYEVLDRLPFDRRALAAYLREREVGRVEIKHRGLPLDPDKLRAQLKLRGSEAATLLVTKMAGHGTVFVVRRFADGG